MRSTPNYTFKLSFSDISLIVLYLSKVSIYVMDIMQYLQGAIYDKHFVLVHYESTRNYV